MSMTSGTPGPRVAICGAGRAATMHAHGFRAAGATVVAVADPRRDAARSLAAGCGDEVRSFDALDAMLEAVAPDIVDIATPHDAHALQAITALEAGCDVFIDKPLATDVSDAERVVAAVEESGRTLAVCHNLLYHPAVVAAAELLDSGQLGTVLAANAWSLGWLDLAPWDFRLDRERTGGGAWIDNSPHLIYTLERLVGPFRELIARTTTAASRIGGEDTAVGVGLLGSGVTASLRISYSYIAPGSHEPWPLGWRQGLEINATAGSLRLTVCPSGRLSYVIGDAPAWTERRFSEPFSVTFDRTIEAFLAVRLGVQSPTMSARESLRVLSVSLGAIA